MRPVLLDNPMSSSMRQRDCMFSSAASDRPAGELVLERRERRLEHALDGQHAVVHAERLRLLLRIIDAHLRGVARGHHHRLHALRPEGIDGDRQRQRRVHPARQPHHHPREAVLAHVVAHARAPARHRRSPRRKAPRRSRPARGTRAPSPARANSTR